jgi:hypothetical protein
MTQHSPFSPLIYCTVWNPFIRPRRARRRLFAAAVDPPGGAAGSDSDTHSVRGGVSEEVLSRFRRMSYSRSVSAVSSPFDPLILESFHSTGSTNASRGSSDGGSHAHLPRRRRLGMLCMPGEGCGGIIGGAGGLAVVTGPGTAAADAGGPVARDAASSTALGARPQPSRRRLPPTRGFSASTAGALLEAATTEATARMVAAESPAPSLRRRHRRASRLPRGSRDGEPLLVFVPDRGGSGSDGLLTPAVVHRLALENFGWGFTPTALESAFLQWRNCERAPSGWIIRALPADEHIKAVCDEAACLRYATRTFLLRSPPALTSAPCAPPDPRLPPALHADLDLVSQLIRAALYILALLKGTGWAPGGAGALMQLLSPVVEMVGLHCAVVCLAAASLVHAALLTAPGFTRWWAMGLAWCGSGSFGRGSSGAVGQARQAVHLALIAVSGSGSLSA